MASSRLLRGATRGVYGLDDALFEDRLGWRRVLGKRHDDGVDALGEAIDSSADARAARGTQGMAAVRTHYFFDAWAGVWRKAVLS